MLNAGDHLAGFLGQSLGGKKPVAGAFNFVANYSAGTYVLTVPRDGFWKFVAWGVGGNCGGSTDPGQASAGYVEVTRFLAAGQTVTLVVPVYTGVPGATTITFPDGSVASAGSAQGGAAPTPGVATGGDVNLNGSAAPGAGAFDGLPGGGTGGGPGGLHQAANSGGSGAPANLPFIGGRGGLGGGGSNSPAGVGAGCGAAGGSVVGIQAGPALVIVLYVN
jgi:hypothetical protein